MTHEDYRFSRIRRGLKQCDLAQMIGTQRARLCMYERHGYPLPERAAKMLRAILGQPVGATATAPGTVDVGQRGTVQ